MDKEKKTKFAGDYEKPEDGDESGYSEEQNDLDIEIRAGEWQSLRRFKTYQQRSRQGKILATYQAVTNRLNELVKAYYKLVGGNPSQGQKLLEEIQKLRLIQELLLNMIVWKPNSEGFDESMIPQEILDLIE